MSRTLLVGGCVLSLDRKVGNFRRGDVLIEDDRHSRGWGEHSGSRCRGHRCHRHDRHARLRRHPSSPLGVVVPGQRKLCGPAASECTADDVYAASLIGLLGAAEAGITTVVDWSEVSTGPHTEAALQAHADSSLRTVFVNASSDPQSGIRSLDAASSPLTTFAAGPAGLEEWAVARELGLRIHAHAGVGGAPADISQMAPMLGADVTLVHCSDFSDADLDAVAGSGARIVLTPSSEMASGPAALADPEARRSRYPPRAGGRHGTDGPGRPLCPDAGGDIPPTRDSLRLEARGQSRHPQAPQHPGCDPLCHFGRGRRHRARRGHRIAGSRQAGRRSRPPSRPTQHLPDQRRHRCGGVGDGHLEHRLGIRRRAAGDAPRSPRGRPGSSSGPGDRRPAACEVASHALVETGSGGMG